jgi:hypothetical protein
MLALYRAQFMQRECRDARHHILIRSMHTAIVPALSGLHELGVIQLLVSRDLRKAS